MKTQKETAAKIGSKFALKQLSRESRQSLQKRLLTPI